MGCGRLDRLLLRSRLPRGRLLLGHLLLGHVELADVRFVEAEAIESNILCRLSFILVQPVTEARCVEFIHGAPTKIRVMDVNLVANFGTRKVVSGERLDDVCVLHNL